MRIFKSELLLDVAEDIRPSDINALLEAMIQNNSHLAKLIICDTQDTTAIKKTRGHEWQFYANGIFCIRCNQPIGTKNPCR